MGPRAKTTHLLGVGERAVCLAQADDWLNHESDESAFKTKGWLNQAATPKQLQYLPPIYGQDYGLTRYRASALMTFKFNKQGDPAACHLGHTGAREGGMNHVTQIASPPASLAHIPDRLRQWHPRFQLCAVCTHPTAGFGYATFANRASREGAAVYVIPGTVAEAGQAKAADVLQMQALGVDLDTGDIPAEHLGRVPGFRGVHRRAQSGVARRLTLWSGGQSDRRTKTGALSPAAPSRKCLAPMLNLPL